MTDRSAMRASVGIEPESGLYYEILGDGTGYPHPLLFIHGGGGTGRTWRSSLGGGAGWADLLAADGYECWVTDWPGQGRSHYRDLLTLRYTDAIDGYISLLRDVIRRPVVILPHSMGGAIAWRLVEELPDLVAGVVGIACVYPANVQDPPEILSDDGTVVHLRFADTGVDFHVDRSRPYTYESQYFAKQSVAGSKHFDPAWLPRMGGSVMGPMQLLQRVGAIPGMPTIERTASFAAKRVRLMAGNEDPAHTLRIETRTAGLLRSWGADAEVVWLPDEGIVGNGHYLPGELNYLDVLSVVEKQFAYIAGSSPEIP